MEAFQILKSFKKPYLEKSIWLQIRDFVFCIEGEYRKAFCIKDNLDIIKERIIYLEKVGTTDKHLTADGLVNVHNKEELENAFKQPDKYPEVTLKVSGKLIEELT